MNKRIGASDNMNAPTERRRSDAKKSAVIALAILVLLLFFWKLMTPSGKMGRSRTVAEDQRFRVPRRGIGRGGRIGRRR